MHFIHKHKTNSLETRLAKAERRYRHRWPRRIIKGLMAIMLAGGVSLAGYWYFTTPKLNTVFVDNHHAKLFTNQVNVRYLDSEDHTFYESNDTTYEPLKISQVRDSSNIVNAITSIEDRNYFHEGGVNWGHTLKAGFDTFTGHGVQGGSTITQQLIKLTFFSTSTKDQTIKRKFQEIVLAGRLSRKFSKYQVLAWYLDKANFGNGQQGLLSASKYYYHKKPQDLNVLESATLIGMVNSPSTYDPYLNPQAMTYRRNLVLESMMDNHKISRSTFEKLSRKSITTDLVLGKTNAENALKLRSRKLAYNGFISGVNAQLSRYDQRLMNSTATVKTSMNKQLQDSVNSIVSKEHYPDGKIQEAIVVINNKTGQVMALSGGRNQTVLGGYNRAFNVRRSSGSAIKPLLDYGPGMDIYHWNPDMTVDDSAYKYPGTNQSVNDWDNQYQGHISMRQALVQSRNIPAVKALVKVGLNNGQQVLKALGLPSQSLFYANAIGVDTSPLALASAYTSLANYGVRVNPRFVDSINNGGLTIKMKPVKEQVYSPQTAYLLTDILKGVFEGSGTATSAKVDRIAEAGKTGTVGRGDKNDALTDGWMIGYTKNYTVAVWDGYDNPYDQKDYLTNQKNKLSFDLYKQVMTAASKLPGSDNSDWSAPGGVNNNQFDSNVDTSNDFRMSSNRVHSYVPFYLNMTPSYFLNPSNTKMKNSNSFQSQLAQLYDQINRDGQ